VSSGVESDAFERRLAADSRVLARLEHPGIVPVHDVGRLVDGRLFYVMKRVQGRTLTAYLRHDIDLNERLRIFERICEAVAFAHARRILHRDLKPDNVMVGAFGEVMVMDWGVAKTLEDGQAPTGAPTPAVGQVGATDHGTVLGTPGYMSPEQARGDRSRVDERSDVYSLGALLRDLLGPGATPRPLRSICARALAADSRDRYPAVTDLGGEIARYRAGAAVRAHVETIVERASRLAKVYRMPILIVVSNVIMRALVAWIVGW
jgi:serine/threonine protein kinase